MLFARSIVSGYADPALASVARDVTAVTSVDLAGAIVSVRN